MKTVEYKPYMPEGNKDRISALLKYCPIPSAIERAFLRKESVSGGMHALDVSIIERQAISRTQKKLDGIGMSLSDYPAVLSAFTEGDVALLRRIADRANKNVARQKEGILTTAERYFVDLNPEGRPVYTPEREKVHEEIIKEALKGKK